MDIVNIILKCQIVHQTNNLLEYHLIQLTKYLINHLFIIN